MARTKQTARKPSRPRKVPVNMNPVDTWRWHLHDLLPGLSEHICAKVSKRIYRLGPHIIFNRLKNMNHNTPPLGKIAFAAEMRRVFTAARNTPNIGTSKSCHEFFKRLRCQYTSMFGKPMPLSKKLELDGTLLNKTRQQAYQESVAAQPPKAGGGMVAH